MSADTYRRMEKISHTEYIALAARLIYPERARYAVAISIGMACSFFGSLVHRNVSVMMQSAFGAPEFTDFLAAAFALNALSGVCSMLRGALMTRVTQRLYAATYRRFFVNVCYASMDSWDAEFNQEDLTKCALSDVGDVVAAATMIANVVSRTMATVLSVTWMLHSASPELCALCMAITLIQVAAIHCGHNVYATYAEATRAIKQRQEHHVNDYVQKHVDLQLYSLQPFYMSLFEDMGVEHATATGAESVAYAAWIFSYHVVPRSLEFVFTYSIFAFGYGARAIELVSYYGIVADAFTGIKDVLSQFIKTRAQAIRVRKYIDAPHFSRPTPEGRQQPAIKFGPPPQIRFDRVTFWYPTNRDKLIYDQFSFTFEPREKWAIIGKSGGGKTTLMKLLLNMYGVNAGAILLNNRSIDTIPICELRGLISIVPQEPLFFPSKTLRENILLCKANDAGDAALVDILNRARLGEFADRLDDKLTSLSGGQKQRLAIARVLATSTPIVIFDEPTSALDEENACYMMNEIETHCKDKTVLFITHNKALISTKMKVLSLS